MSTQISILIVHQSKRDINQVPYEQLRAAMDLTKAAYTLWISRCIATARE